MFMVKTMKSSRCDRLADNRKYNTKVGFMIIFSTVHLPLLFSTSTSLVPSSPQYFKYNWLNLVNLIWSKKSHGTVPLNHVHCTKNVNSSLISLIKIDDSFKTNMYILRISLIDKSIPWENQKDVFLTYFLRPELSATNDNIEPLKTKGNIFSRLGSQNTGKRLIYRWNKLKTEKMYCRYTSK